MNDAPQSLDREGIAARIPHRGSMCLLDQLERWDAQTLHACTGRHADPANPLRTASGLMSACAIEFAAQAMALHGGLLAAAGSRPSAGYLASTRQVRLHVPRLDDRPGPLHLRVERLSGDARQVMYAFAIEDGEGQPVADGRAVVVLNAALPGAAAA